MKEAFVAALLAIARRDDGDELDDEFKVGEYVKNRNAGDVEDLIL